MDKFKTIEEAQTAYDKLAEENKVLGESNKAFEEKLRAETSRADDAQKAALEMNSKLEDLDKYDDVIVTVNKSRYRINFGVDGKTKEELKEDKVLLKRLVEIQSGSLTLVD